MTASDPKMKAMVTHSDNDEVDLEKEAAHAEVTHQNGNLTAEESAFLAGFSEEQRKAVLRKVDWRLVPVLLILYLISFIDRANIGKSRCPCSAGDMLTSFSRQCED